MPRVFASPADPVACDIAEMLDALNETGFDPNDEESLQHGVHWLARLNANRDFLAEIMLAELKNTTGSQEEASDYGAQVVMLSPLGGE